MLEYNPLIVLGAAPSSLGAYQQQRNVTAPATEKNRQVTQALQDTVNEVEQLEKVVAYLSEKLAPLIMPTPEKDSQLKESAGDVTCDLANRIHSIRYRIRLYNDKLGRLAQGIEL